MNSFNALQNSIFFRFCRRALVSQAPSKLVCGGAFVGLAAPHLVRSAVKTTHGRLMVLSALTGGALLLAADILARAWIAPQELPVGVLTAVLGGGYLLWLMHRGRGQRGVA